MSSPGAVIVVRHHPVPLPFASQEAERFLLGYRMQHGVGLPDVEWRLAQVWAEQPLVEVRVVPACECALCLTAGQGLCALTQLAGEVAS
jgi:hypothetical protein